MWPGGNNYPLRGGKKTFFEGGVRVTSYISGGFLPPHVRGQTRKGYIHVCDWQVINLMQYNTCQSRNYILLDILKHHNYNFTRYATLSHLAGVDPHDNYTVGYPDIDGMNMWPYLTADVMVWYLVFSIVLVQLISACVIINDHITFFLSFTAQMIGQSSDANNAWLWKAKLSRRRCN